MAYCTISNLKKYGINAGKPFPKSTSGIALTQDDVNDLISFVYREINSLLNAAGITVPVVQATYPDAYALLTDINSLGAAAWVQRNGYSVQSEQNASKHSTTLMDEYKERLKSVVKDTKLLIDAGGISTSKNTCLSRTKDLQDLEDPDDITEHRFYRGQEW